MSKINPLFFALGIPVVVIVILVAIVVPRMGGGGKFAELTPFSVEAYRKDWATLQGNTYRLDCQVEQQLAFVEGRGRVLAVKPIEKDPTRPATRWYGQQRWYRRQLQELVRRRGRRPHLQRE